MAGPRAGGDARPGPGPGSVHQRGLETMTVEQLGRDGEGIEPAHLIAASAGYPATEIVTKTTVMRVDDGFDVLAGRHGTMIEMGIIDPLRVDPSARQNGASAAGLLLTANTLVAQEQTPWGGSPALITEFGSLDEGLRQPSPDSSTPQALGLGPSIG